jgi:hypothetical protein
MIRHMRPDETGTYADQVTITFYQVPDRSGKPVIDSYEVRIQPHGNIDLDWLSDEINDLFRQSEPDPETGIRYSRDDYVLTQRRTELHWGANATAVQFIVETAAFIGEHGAEAVVGAGVLGLIQKLDGQRQRWIDLHHYVCRTGRENCCDLPRAQPTHRPQLKRRRSPLSVVPHLSRRYTGHR